MGKSYSLDLRERVLQAIDEGMSKWSAHRTFRISRTTIDDWFALRAQNGHLAQPARRPSVVSGLQGAEFEEFVRRHAHSTLGEMAHAWHQEKGVPLTPMTFSRALRRLGWTRKKRAGVIRSVTKSRAPRGRRNWRR